MLFAGDAIQSRRAIEALRSGVPNGDAVRALGSAQPQIEERFRHQLAAARECFAKGQQAPGLLIAGGFGSGKSHMLEHFRQVALEQNFVCSKIVVSKETPLYDSTKLYRAAIQSAAVPGKRGSALKEIAAGFDFRSNRYAEFFRLVNRGSLDLNSRFAATLFLFERMNDQEVVDEIISFWSGDPLSVGELRSWLRPAGEAATYNLERVTARDLSLQRFRFIPHLAVAAGLSGWVLLVDEVELIARYSFKQRARSYAELARWMGKLEGESFPALTAVFAITDDYQSEVLDQRNDEEAIPGKLRATRVVADELLAGQAERGMRLIAREAATLRSAGSGTIERTRALVRTIHAQAYHWDPPPLDSEQRLTTTSMREHVRRWITEWDFDRLDPQYAVDVMASELRIDLSDSADEEVPVEGTEVQGPEDDASGDRD